MSGPWVQVLHEALDGATLAGGITTLKKTGDTLLVISGELLELIDLSPEAFSQQILASVGAVTPDVGGKVYLSQLLKEISDSYDISSDFQGVVNVVYFR